MTNTQLFLAIGLPILVILTSLAISMWQISGVREDLRENMRQMRTEMNALRTELRTETKEALATFNGSLAGIRDDIKTMTGKLADLDTRVSVIEERLKI